ncbi:MAG: hypothetical protein JOZ86_08845 [Candidatus Eremiobacteraeota bacterium]|nr:hypothetical protein [Candidatus Eremiobacteraeota bacterium]
MYIPAARAALTGALALLSCTLPVAAQGDDPPVSVDRCTVWSGLASTDAASFEIAFRNDRAITATAIDFAISWDGAHAETVRDAGRFAPHATIAHRFVRYVPTSLYVYDHPSARCRVTRVRFADGHTWEAA